VEIVVGGTSIRCMKKLAKYDSLGGAPGQKNWYVPIVRNGFLYSHLSRMLYVYRSCYRWCLMLWLYRHGECAEESDAYEANFITLLDENGKESLFGSLVFKDKVCTVGRDEKKRQRSVCQPIDLPELLVDDFDVRRALSSEAMFPTPPQSFVRGRSARNYNKLVDVSVSRDTSPHRELIYDDTGKNLDVLVVWTRDAECVQSGLPVGCTRSATTHANMMGLVNLAVFETNVAFDLSGINTNLRLVHAYRSETYVENTSGTLRFTQGLSELRNTTDGKLDDVHAKRTLYGADVVSMIVSGGAYCGIAYPGPVKTSMFSVIHRNCATGYYSFGHGMYFLG
jgi:hypothetical protein